MKILHRLTQLACRKGLADPLVEPIHAKVAVRIDRKGRFLKAEDLPEKTWFELPREALRSSDIVAQILWDKPPYLLGVAPHKKQTDVPPRREESRVAHRRLADAAPKDIRLAAAAAFVEGKPTRLKEPRDVNHVLFFEDDELPIGSLESTRAALAATRIADLNIIGRGICPVTGEEDALVVGFHAKVKPLPGANAAGGSLVSFDPFSSHGWGHTASANLQIGLHAYFAYPTAMRWLLLNQRVHLTDDHTLVFWSLEEDDEWDRMVGDVLDGGPERAAQGYALLEEIHRRSSGTCCFAVMHGSQGRAHVAWWAELPKDQVAHALYRHANHFACEDYHPSLRRILLAATRPDPKKPLRNVRNPTALALVQAAVGAGPAPASLARGAMSEIERRLAAGDELRDVFDPVRLRALQAIIDTRNGVQPVNEHGLDLTRTDPPYVLGSIFAVMEEIQRRAIFSIARNKRGGIAEHFLREAKNHPTRVFGTLMARCRQHILKLQKKRMSGYWYLNDVYLNYSAKLQEIPARLTLEDQAVFMLGYDHTRAALRWRKAEPSEDGASEASVENLDEAAAQA